MMLQYNLDDRKTWQGNETGETVQYNSKVYHKFKLSSARGMDIVKHSCRAQMYSTETNKISPHVVGKSIRQCSSSNIQIATEFIKYKLYSTVYSYTVQLYSILKIPIKSSQWDRGKKLLPL